MWMVRNLTYGMRNQSEVFEAALDIVQKGVN